MTPEQLKLLQRLSELGEVTIVKRSATSLVTAISEMNSKALELILEDDISYQDTTKEIFLNKVQTLFEAYKKAGDTELRSYPGTCNADCTLCENYGKSGFRLVGNNSANYTDLIFELAGEDIKDIYHCSQLKTDQAIEDLANQFSIYVDADEKVTFKKTTEYWSKLNAAHEAMDEIVTTPPSWVDYETLCYWIVKNSVVNDHIGGDPIFGPTMKWTPFLLLFFELEHIGSFLKKNNVLLAKAMSEANEKITEVEQIGWLLYYLALYEEAPFEVVYGLLKKNMYYEIKGKNTIYFHGPEFKNAFDFFEFYKEHYYPLLEKYTTYKMLERAEAFNDQESQRNGIDITSLRFHLEKRKALEEIGITIPFYVEMKNELPF